MTTLLPPVRAGTADPEMSPKRTLRTEAVERLTRVLLVEDEPLTAEVFAKALTRDGHEVEVASDGLQALRRLHHRLPTVIVLDMNLPALPGAEVIRRFRAEGNTAVPIVVVSGSSPHMASLTAAELHPGTWLEKPVKPRDLVRIVREFVQQ